GVAWTTLIGHTTLAVRIVVGVAIVVVRVAVVVRPGRGCGAGSKASGNTRRTPAPVGPIVISIATVLTSPNTAAIEAAMCGAKPTAAKVANVGTFNMSDARLRGHRKSGRYNQHRTARSQLFQHWSPPSLSKDSSPVVVKARMIAKHDAIVRWFMS